MERTVVPIDLLRKLAIAGQNAGFSAEDMIALLRAGMTIEQLLNIIDVWFVKERGIRLSDLLEI